MKMGKKVIVYVLEILIGATLLGLGMAELLSEFWSGMGGALIAVGAIRLVQCFRLYKDDTYREKMETELKDERNCFIRNKAWAWSGYAFVMIAAISTIVLQILGQELLSTAAGSAVCLLLILYWLSYLLLKRKY